MGLPAGLGEELLSVTQPEFWEITDRGVNFDYIAPPCVPPSANCSSSCRWPKEQ